MIAQISSPVLRFE